MQGLRIHSKLSFGQLFVPVFGYLKAHHWLLAGAALAQPGATLPPGLQRVPRSNGAPAPAWGWSACCDLFPQHAAAIGADWHGIYAFASPVADPAAWFQAYQQAPDRGEFLCAEASAVFLNADGAWRAFFSRRRRPVDRLMMHLAGLGIGWEVRRLQETALA